MYAVPLLPEIHIPSPLLPENVDSSLIFPFLSLRENKKKGFYDYDDNVKCNVECMSVILGLRLCCNFILKKENHKKHTHRCIIHSTIASLSEGQWW